MQGIEQGSWRHTPFRKIVLADFNFHGIPIHWELDFTAWCDSLSTYLKPIVIAMASFSAVLILAGVRENG